MRRQRFERTTFIAAPAGRVFAFFSLPENLGRITPPWTHFRILSAPEGRIREGDRIEYALRLCGIPMRWASRIVLWRDGEAFADLQERGPYRYWMHTHTFRNVEGGVEMHDRVDYELPFGFLGRLVAGRLVAQQLQQIFAFRANALRDIFPV